VAVTAVLGLTWPGGVRRRILGALQEPFLCLLRDGTLGDFCSFHYQLGELLRGDVQGDFSDEHLLELCRASAERVASWRRSGKSTRDFGWPTGLTGQATADLIRAVVTVGRDRNYFRRELPPVIDCLGEFGAPGVATELRVLLRRG
jgi:hypothetical protein